MEIETDYEPCEVRQGRRCGAGIRSSIVYSDARLREMRRCETNAAAHRRERSRLRDAAYARWERENGVQPAVTVSDYGVRTEIRGRVPAGFRAVGHVSHS